MIQVSTYPPDVFSIRSVLLFRGDADALGSFGWFQTLLEEIEAAQTDRESLTFGSEVSQDTELMNGT